VAYVGHEKPRGRKTSSLVKRETQTKWFKNPSQGFIEESVFHK